MHALRGRGPSRARPGSREPPRHGSSDPNAAGAAEEGFGDVSTRCKFCFEPSVREFRLGKATVPVCARHDTFARDAGRELVNTGARMAGAAMKERFPLAYETGAALFVALRAARERGEGSPET